MFSQVSLREGVGTSHASWDSSYGTIPLSPRPGDLLSTPLLLTSGGHHQRPVQTCSLEDLPILPVLTSSGNHCVVDQNVQKKKIELDQIWSVSEVVFSCAHSVSLLLQDCGVPCDLIYGA